MKIKRSSGGPVFEMKDFYTTAYDASRNLLLRLGFLLIALIVGVLFLMIRLGMPDMDKEMEGY